MEAFTNFNKDTVEKLAVKYEVFWTDIEAKSDF